MSQTTALLALALVLPFTSCQQQTPAPAHEQQSATQPGAPPPAPQILGTPANTVMTPEYVVTVARFAYLWGWPLVNNLNRARAVEKLPEPGRVGGVIPMAPPGQVSMLTDYIDEKERFVTCPNQDT